MRIATEKLFPLRENIKAGEEEQEKANREEHPQSWRCVFEFMNGCEEIGCHRVVSILTGNLAAVKRSQVTTRSGVELQNPTYRDRRNASAGRHLRRNANRWCRVAALQSSPTRGRVANKS